MPRIIDPLLAELAREADVTRAVLERVPEDKLKWSPHARSMSLGQLAMHIAALPGILAKIASGDSFDVSTRNPNQAAPASHGEIMAALDESLGAAKQFLNGCDDVRAMGTWKLMKGDTVLVEMPRVAVVRFFMLNHWYHHRGQLTVYLRMLDVPLPSVYGPSADENPFA